MSIEKLSAMPEWKIVKQLGEGSHGKVYQVMREEHGITVNAALKVISIPQSPTELASLRSEGFDENGTRVYLESVVADFVNEIKLLESMKGTSNIVSIEDFRVIERTAEIGWDIYIRMELLTPFTEYIAGKELLEEEVIKLGQDVCSALELCASQNIIHRDIKPENIFVSSFGDFKLGDFGISRKLETTKISLSLKGTPNYMAPEIKASKDCDATVDIYSLGLVLYKLLNNNRLPFLDPHSQTIRYQDQEAAIERRISGEALSVPVNASSQLAQVILTACAYDPTNRFQTPTSFKQALGAAKEDKFIHSVPALTPMDLNTTIGTRRAPAAAQPVAQKPDVLVRDFGKKKKFKRRKNLVSFVALLCFFVVVIGLYVMNSSDTHATDVIAALEDGYTDEALLLAESVDNDTLQSSLEERLDTLVDDFLNEEIEFLAVTMELNTIERMNIPELSDKLNTSRTFVNDLNDSRTAFNTAETMFERGHYAGAITQYQLVIFEDPNYDKAVYGVIKATDAFRTEALSAASDYSNYGDYGRAINVIKSALLVIENDSELTQQLNIYSALYEIGSEIGSRSETITQTQISPPTTQQQNQGSSEQRTQEATGQQTQEASGQRTQEPTGQRTQEATGQRTQEATGQRTQEATGQRTQETTGQRTQEPTEFQTQQRTEPQAPEPTEPQNQESPEPEGQESNESDD